MKILAAPGLRTTFGAFLLLLAYVLTGVFSLYWATVKGAGAAIWIPAGIGMAGLLYGGIRFWPVIFIGRLLSGFLSGSQQPLWSEMAFAAGNALTTVIGVWLLQGRSGQTPPLNTLRNMLRFLVGTALLPAALAAIVGTACLYLSADLPLAALPVVWLRWACGNAASVLVLTGLAVSLRQDRLAPGEAWHLAVMLAIASITGFLVFVTGPGAPLQPWHIYPILIWAALALRNIGAASALLIVESSAIVGVLAGVGPFVDLAPQPAGALFFLQQFLVLTASTILLLSAVADERRGKAKLERTQQALQHLNEELESRVQQRTAELAAARDAAEAANRAKSGFLANMSHEIRTPLHGMLGMAQRLQEAPLPAEQLQQVQVIERSGQLLLGVIDDVLDFSRIESGRLELEREPFDLVQLAQDAVALFEPRAQAKNLELQLALEPGVTQAWLLGDSLRLSQILNNLLSNAVKFTATGGVVLQLSALGKGRWRVAVRDTGIGLSTADRRRIFEPFMQADSSTTRRFGGTGLGLAIVRSLVQLHGGELGVDSELGRGTEFWFVLEWPPASQPSEEPSAVPGQIPGGCLAGRRALVAEDNEVNMALACAILQALDMSVLQAANGVEAVQAFGGDRPDVVLMDMHMPEMDGLDATRRIRALEAARGWARTPIVALTASALPEDRQRCIDAGMDDVLVKPFQSGHLQSVLERYRQ